MHATRACVPSLLPMNGVPWPDRWPTMQIPPQPGHPSGDSVSCWQPADNRGGTFQRAAVPSVVCPQVHLAKMRPSTASRSSITWPWQTSRASAEAGEVFCDDREEAILQLLVAGDLVLRRLDQITQVCLGRVVDQGPCGCSL
jgi:hypothetical protein